MSETTFLSLHPAVQCVVIICAFILALIVLKILYDLMN